MSHNHQSVYLTYEAALEAQKYWLYQAGLKVSIFKSGVNSWMISFP